MDKEELKDFLKALKAAGFKADDIEVNVVSPKKDTIGNLNALKDEIFKEKSEATEDSAPEKKAEGFVALLQSNMRFYKFAKNMTEEYCRVSQLAADFVKENESLRKCLGEKA